MENVLPAIMQTTNEKTLKELSPQEFQAMLSSWFQEKGLVQDMKSYLKFQMMNVLRNTAIGKNIKRSASQTYTLAQQALHLIVAEYLLYYRCHFALSLFTTEVNLSHALPETKLLFEADNASESKFDKANVVSILELIGIAKESQHFSRILHEYFDKRGSPLLSLLLGLIDRKEEENKADLEFQDDFMTNIYQALQASNLPRNTHTQLLHNLKVSYELKTKSYESQVIQLVSKFKKELSCREQKLYRSQKRRRCLEKRLVKLREENRMLREKIEVISSEEKGERVIEKIVSIPCSLAHCSEDCTNNRRLSESYKKEIEKLKSVNNHQREEIEKLNFKYKDLLDEFNSCQSKINLVNARLQEDLKAHDLQTVCNEQDSLSSDSVTEEIVQQARQKLKLLEDESEELDIRFSSFVIK